MVSLGVQDTGLIHFEKVRDGEGVHHPAGAGRERPFDLFGLIRPRLSSRAGSALPRAISILIFSNDAEKAVLFIGNSSSEKHSVGEWQKIPKAVKLQRRSIRPLERFYKIAADWIVIVDESITEVANPKVGAFHERKSPWGIEVSI
jgi:hypothetical protein